MIFSARPNLDSSLDRRYENDSVARLPGMGFRPNERREAVNIRLRAYEFELGMICILTTGVHRQAPMFWINAAPKKLHVTYDQMVDTSIV